MKTTSTINITFDKSLHEVGIPLGRAITGAPTAEGMKEITLPIKGAENVTVIPQVNYTLMEAFKLISSQGHNYTYVDTVQINMYGIPNKEVVSAILKRVSASLKIIALTDFNVTGVDVNTHYDLTK